MTQKIAIIGAPGCGKTTIASGLFYALKTARVRVEIVPELAKVKLYKGEDFLRTGFDIQNTMEQKSLEEILDGAISQGKVDCVIAESPLCNGFFYASFYGKEIEAPFLREVARMAINSYDVMLHVTHLPNTEYESFGRHESEAESRRLSCHIRERLQELNYRGRVVDVTLSSPLSDLVEVAGFPSDVVGAVRRHHL